MVSVSVTVSAQSISQFGFRSRYWTYYQNSGFGRTLMWHSTKHLNSLALKHKFFYSSYRNYPRPKWPKSTMASFWDWRFWRVEFTNDSWFYWLHGYSQEEICYIKRARSWWPGNYLCLPIYSKPLSYNVIKCSQKMLHSSKLQSTRLVLFSVA